MIVFTILCRERPACIFLDPSNDFRGRKMANWRQSCERGQPLKLRHHRSIFRYL